MDLKSPYECCIHLETQEASESLGGCSFKETSMNKINSLNGTEGASDSTSNLPTDTLIGTTDHSLVTLRSYKRKSPASRLLPWHEEVVNICDLLPDKRMAEQEWTQATNRLIEEPNESERPRKRLILTTRLMQTLLHPNPGTILAKKSLSTNAALSYDSVVYIVARLLLGHACNMSFAGDKPSSQLDMEELVVVSRALNKFSARIKQLEDKLQRLNNKPSLVDISVELLEFERFSLINRFAKFHSRMQPNPSGLASSSMYLERYVAAQPMPKDVPDGLQCVSL